ncbi:hypothetical protein B0H10DRAFT_2230332 [Mycena sp. CBHHK59/15]|nr:hypothetical protein B0H10DRAFT_2230332 [Mycena sp. CBHHK59/15]
MPDPPFSRPSSDPTADLPTLCSTRDHDGGGLASSNCTSTFVVYTATTVPPSLQHLCRTPPPGLASLASTVAERIPIHFTISSLDGELVSLPCPPLSAGRGREVNRLPWFFINAAGCFRHAIAGRGSTVETLLAVLRRPWCVLELCCTPVSAVEPLLAFAECAAEFDHMGYGAAVVLLRHELAAREEEDVGKVTGPILSLFGGPSLIERASRTSASIPALRTMCFAVFSTSVRSYNGFWLRLVCISALQLGMSYSRLGSLLNGGHSGDVLALSDDEAGGGVRRWRWRGLSEGLPNTESEPKEVLLSVYARVLERIENEVV